MLIGLFVSSFDAADGTEWSELKAAFMAAVRVEGSRRSRIGARDEARRRSGVWTQTLHSISHSRATASSVSRVKSRWSHSLIRIGPAARMIASRPLASCCCTVAAR